MITKHNAYDVQVASKTDPAARYVRATDYAALEAERDEWRRRCEESFTEWQWCLLGFIGGWSCFGLIGVLAL